MPVYYIYYDESAFTSAQKQSIANGIADAHVAATDAPRFFVKVAFVGRAHGDLFSNGAAAPDMVQVVGNIRAGRDSAHRYKLLTLLDDVIVRNAGGKKFLVEVTLMERPAEVRSIFYHYCHLLVLKMFPSECVAGGHEGTRSWISRRGSLQRPRACPGGYEIYELTQIVKTRLI